MTARRDDGWGPAMRALSSDRHRAFVQFYVLGTVQNTHKDNYGSQAAAARAAGFGRPTSKPITLAHIAWRLMQDERIQTAVAEESRKLLRAGAPEAVRAVLAGIADPKSKDHARFCAMVLDRTDPVETTHHVSVEKKTPDILIVTDQVLQRIEVLALKAGLDPVRQVAAVKQIEGTATEVKDDEQH